ncbi:MASE1 domain-containing protein [Mycoplana rhizolycopersici]|uniref:histidine kinase n=1 Tax=Mycoplana rhizolycopersici TaxID=2746702 RepID=A0ABX2QKU7_9HYPH|nr:MASE1 domain-containing protein [Rhizobium rhizolycopersici]NVP58305.1 MASE1 domain-containing protein [Rhizobium rhizolycopersici]
MMSVWSSRPRLQYLGLFFAAYVLGCGFADALAIVPGITVSIWPPAGVFVATLILTAPYTWPWWMLSGCLAEMFAQFVWFHSPLPVGLLIYAGNALCAATGATLVNLACGRPLRMETLREVLAFVWLGAGVAPLASATVGSAALAWFGVEDQSFAEVWPLFWIGDATGILLVGPLSLMVIQHWHGRTRLSAARWTEASLLGLVFLAAAALSLSTDYLASAYIIMPPLLWAAVRFEFKGVAVALTLLALITMALTISGGSHFVGDPETQREKQVMLQLFLAISAFSSLIVAAISRQNQKALLSLGERERELSQLVDMVPVHIRRMTAEGEPIFFNKRLLDFFGLDSVTRLDKQGMSRLAAAIHALVHPDDAAELLATARHSFATGEPFAQKYRMRRADGVYRWVDGRGEPLRDQGGAIVQWYVISIDIDDEMRAQEALRRSERQLQQMIDAVPALIWCMTPEGIPCYLNKRAVDVTGLTVKDMVSPEGSRTLAVIHPDEREAVEGVFAHAVSTGTPIIARYRQHRAKGPHRWVESRSEPLRDETGAIIQWYGVSVDIDDLVKAQDDLRNRERELSQLVDMVPSLLWRLSPKGEPTFFSKRLVEFCGLDVSDFDGPRNDRLAEAIATLFHPDDIVRLEETLKRSLATGESFNLSYRMRRADGTYRWMSGRAEPLRDDDGRIVQWFGLSHDIDDQVRIEEELHMARESLARASQIASLAELSAAIAHEVNQPLAAIVANSSACQGWLAATPPNLERAQKTVERIIDSAHSASDVVTHIRALFRPSVETRTKTTIESVVFGARDLMAEEAARRRIRMTMDVEGNLPPVLLDRIQVQQILVNLIRNGMDAMNAVTEDRVLKVRAHRPGEVIEIDVIDRGGGVSSPEKIFEPFFTTKERGMGMGLAICRSIVESHGGQLWVENNELEGATFRFTLPIEAELT